MNQQGLTMPTGQKVVSPHSASPSTQPTGTSSEMTQAQRIGLYGVNGNSGCWTATLQRFGEANARLAKVTDSLGIQAQAEADPAYIRVMHAYVGCMGSSGVQTSSPEFSRQSAQTRLNTEMAPVEARRGALQKPPGVAVGTMNPEQLAALQKQINAIRLQEQTISNTHDQTVALSESCQRTSGLADLRAKLLDRQQSLLKSQDPKDFLEVYGR